MSNFANFNKLINADEVNKLANEAPEYKTVPDGKYIVSLDKMEVNPTKDGSRLRLSGQFRIQEGSHKNQCVFYSQNIAGNTSPKFTDSMACGAAVNFLRSLDVFENEEVFFEDYDQFNDLALDIAEESNGMKWEIDYRINDAGYGNVKRIIRVVE